MMRLDVTAILCICLPLILGAPLEEELLKQRLTFPGRYRNNGEAYPMYPGQNLMRNSRFDSLGGEAFGLQKKFDSLGGSTFGSAYKNKKNFDEIDNLGFNNFKRNFDEIDASGFKGFN